MKKSHLMIIFLLVFSISFLAIPKKAQAQDLIEYALLAGFVDHVVVVFTAGGNNHGMIFIPAVEVNSQTRAHIQATVNQNTSKSLANANTPGVLDDLYNTGAINAVIDAVNEGSMALAQANATIQSLLNNASGPNVNFTSVKINGTNISTEFLLGVLDVASGVDNANKIIATIAVPQ